VPLNRPGMLECGMEIVDTWKDADTRFQWNYWGQLLEFQEDALLGILAHVPAARSPEDGLWRALAIKEWIHDQQHSGGVMMRGLDGHGEPLGSEDLPVLAIELTSEDAEARTRGAIMRSRVMVAASDPRQVDQDTLWVPTIDHGPDFIENLREVGEDYLPAWTQKIWQANLDWLSSKRTHLMAIATLDAGSQGRMDFECLREFLAFSQHPNTGVRSWDRHITDRIEQTYPDLRIGQARLLDLSFTIASPARLAVIQARNLSDDTQPASISRSGHPRL
jgi:hypothetical protein